MHEENKYYFAHNDLGEITHTYYITQEAKKTLESSGVVLKAGFVDRDIHYAPNGNITLRPNMPVKLEGNTLRGVPDGSFIQINNTTYEDCGGDVELEFSAPGTYKVLIICWPYINAEFTLEN